MPCIILIYNQGNFSDGDWPSSLNRPTLNGTTLSWVGPLGGGPNNGNPVQQSRVLTSQAFGTLSANTSGGNFANGAAVNGNNFTISQCAFHVDASNILNVADGCDNLIIEDCAIFGPGFAGTSNSGGFGINLGASSGIGNVIIRRCNIYGVNHGIDIDGGGPLTGKTLTISDTYIHDIGDSTPGVSHYDCVYFGGGDAGSIIFLHNQMINANSQTSAIFTESFFGAVNAVSLIHNKLSGLNYTFYCRNSGFGNPTNIILTNNLMGAVGQLGYASIDGTGVTPSGNVDIFTGANIDSQL